MVSAYNLLHSNVMVAGGAGFVGSALVRELAGMDVRNVICFDNFFRGVPENVYGLPSNVTVVQGDALVESEVVKVMREYDVDYIINCIGDTFVPSAYKFPERFFDINLIATLNILKAARACPVKRILYVSSTEVYGVTGLEKIGEDAPLAPVNTYAVSKLAADRLCYTFVVEHEIPVIIARIFNCYGPRETHPYVIPEIITQFNRGNEIWLGNIMAERDLTFVHDTARALIAVLMSSLPNGDAVNVGSNCTYSVKWLTETIAEIMQVSRPQIHQDPNRLRRMDIDHFQCDNEKLKLYTNWEPTVGILDGLVATVDWYRQNGCLWSWENSDEDPTTYAQEESTSSRMA